MPTPVTDPALLAQLDGGAKPVTDPAVLAQLDAPKFGLGDTWPARIAKSVWSGLTLPGDVYQGKAQLPSSGAVPGSVPFGDPNSAGERVADLAGLANPINPMVRSGDRAIAGVAQALKSPKAPSAEALKGMAQGQYKAAGDMGVEIGAPAVQNFGQSLQSGLEKDGVIAELAPKTFSILKRIQDPPDGAVATIENISAIRRSLGHAAGDFTNKTEQFAAQRAIDQLDEFIAALPAGASVAGPAAAAGKTIEAARGNFAAAQRSNKITGTLDNTFGSVLDRADINAAVANSGQNADNAIRQRIRDVLVSPKQARGYSEGELGQMERVARGSLPTNTARMIGNLLGGGGGLGAAVTAGIGAAAAGPLGAAAPGVGYAAKQLANALTKRELSKLDEMIRQRSPMYEAMPKQPASHAGTSALIRALLEARPQQ